MSGPTPLRVLSVIHYPAFGGPQGRNLALARHFRARGEAELTVLLPDPPGPAAERLTAAGVPVRTQRLGRLRAVGDPRVHAATAAGWPGDVARLVRAIRATRAQVVLLNGLANAQAALAARLAGVGLVWQLLDTRTPPLLVGALRPLVLRSAAVMATGRRVAEQQLGADACARLGARLVAFHPPVDAARFRPDPAAARAARAELGLGDAPVVGCIANLTPQKGHDAFLAAAARLRARQPAVRFLWLGQSFAGQHAYADGLVAQARRHGLRPGHELVIRDPGPDVAWYARAMDIAWLTSPARAEGIPTAAAEAMALAKPLVGFDIGGVRDLVDGTGADTPGGALVPPGDTAALAEVTAALLGDRGRRAALGAAARARVAAGCTLDACAAAHLTAFRLAAAATEARRGRA